MPIMRAPGAARRSPAAAAENAAKKAEQAKARGRLPTLDAYLKINNPNANQQRDQITLLTNAAMETVKGVA